MNGVQFLEDQIDKYQSSRPRHWKYEEGDFFTVIWRNWKLDTRTALGTGKRYVTESWRGLDQDLHIMHQEGITQNRLVSAVTVLPCGVKGFSIQTLKLGGQGLKFAVLGGAVIAIAPAVGLGKALNSIPNVVGGVLTGGVIMSMAVTGLMVGCLLPSE